MAKPRLIILIRHAQSEGNKKREIHQTIPDHRVKLTQDGWQQAYDAGRRLRGMLRADDTLHFFTSPYRRTRETTEGILATLTADEPEPSPFKRNNIKVYEEPRLREQDFGNFQPCSAEMERMWQERADYGHFFYRIPNGESAADAYDRVSGFNESLWRQFGDDDFASVCVLVTHGLMSRVFLMKWYHFSVEYFEDLRNVNHCEFLIMRRRDESGKYILENKLRTWSELRREREAVQKQREKDKDGKEGALTKVANVAASSSSSSIAKLDKATAAASAATSSPVIGARRWGGCPNGCNHDKDFKIRSGLADLVRRDGTAIYATSSPVTSNRAVEDLKRSTEELGSNSEPESTEGAILSTRGSSTLNSSSSSSVSSSIASRRPNARRFNTGEGGADGSSSSSTLAVMSLAPEIDVTRAREEVVSSPDGTPSFISIDHRLRAQLESPNINKPPLLHVGRDFGGTYSGHTSDADSSEDDSARSRLARMKLAIATASSPQDGGARNGNTAAAAGEPRDGSAVGACSDNAASVGSPAGASNGSSGLHHRRDLSGMGRGAYANRLGDAPHCDHDHSEAENGDHEMSDNEEDRHGLQGKKQEAAAENGAAAATAAAEDDALAEAEREDKSLRGSVY